MIDQATSQTKQLRRPAWFLAAVLGGGLCGFLAVIIGLRWFGPGALPLLDRARFESARRQWQAAAPASYNIEIQVVGPQPATYYVEVREGTVSKATRNDQPLRQRRTMGTWSVPGMFGTMASDVANLDRARRGEIDAATPQLVLRAQFDPRNGLPRRYHRTEKVRWGSNSEVSWTVTRFEVLDGPAGANQDRGEEVADTYRNRSP